jgi:hypothetical protein
MLTKKSVQVRSTLLVGALVASFLYAATPRPLPDVPIPVPSGKPINLKSYRGKVLLFAMISTDCAACIKSIDILNRAQTDFGAQGFQVVAAAGDQNAQYMLGLFTQRYRPIFPMGYLNVDEMARLGDLNSKESHFAPIFLFVDRKGIIRQQYSGEMPFFKTEESETRRVIREMLKP